MSPVSLNPPAAKSSCPLISDQIHDRPHLFISPDNHQTSSILSYRTFFNIIKLDQRQTASPLVQDQGGKLVFHDGSSNCQASLSSEQPIMDDHLSNKMEVEESKSTNGYRASKWMPSKIRLMRKMITPDRSASSTVSTPPSQNQQLVAETGQRSPSSTTRVCSECNTTSTPLWRSGPRGPKSLCNACGIRQRKARKAMVEAAAAANGAMASVDGSGSTVTKIRGHNKEKRPRTNHCAQIKNKSKNGATTSAAAGTSTSQGERNPAGFEDFAMSFSDEKLFQPRDEVAEAALMLLELSCDFAHV